MAITLDLKKMREVSNVLKILSDVNTVTVLRLHDENPDLRVEQISVKTKISLGIIKKCQEALEQVGLLDRVTDSGPSLYEVNTKKLVEFQKYLKKFPRRDPKQLTLNLKFENL